MNACENNNTATFETELERTMRSLVPEVSNLLQRITNAEPTITYTEDSVRMASPLSFPDGIGEGALTANLFHYRDGLRLDIRVDHNRVFAGPHGGPSDRRCFLNDYIASRAIEGGTESLPTDFVRMVVAGVAVARDAVHRHNKKAKAPWNEVRVAERTGAPEPVG